MKQYNFLIEGWFDNKPSNEIDYNPDYKDLQNYVFHKLRPKIEPQAKKLILNYLLTKYPQTRKLNPHFDEGVFEVNGTIDLINPEKQMYLCQLFSYVNFKPKSRYFGEYVNVSVYVMFNLQGMFKITNVVVGHEAQNEY